MPEYALTILYVDDPPASANFYGGLLRAEPSEVAPTFAMIPLKGGVALGLWSKHTVQPPARSSSGSAEVAFTVTDDEALDRLHAVWSAKGLMIEQAPIDMDFGRTFVALDPDGHRLRVFAPNGK